jgi:protein-tyrosine-phosphatase
MKTILFVCTANICRSPMAAALMHKRIAEWGLADQVEVQSAGMWARDGERASDGATMVLGRRGISLQEHRSQMMTSELLEAASIVLVMEEEHRRSLFYLDPKHLRKVFLLTEMVGHSEEIADPYGGPLEGYAETADQLDRLIGDGLPMILRRIGVARPQQS